jgi:ribonuclease P protein component
MLPAHHRLTRKQDFVHVYDQGVFVPGTLVNLKVWKIDPAAFPDRGYAPNDFKIGFVVSTKIHKHAVKRNRAKRQMREVVRLLMKDNVFSTGYLVVVLAKPQIVGAAYEDIRASLHQAFMRAHLTTKKI